MIPAYLAAVDARAAAGRSRDAVVSSGSTSAGKDDEEALHDLPAVSVRVRVR